VSALKPSPAGLLHAVELLAAGGVAMVGDASIDGIAANRAGVPFIAFRPTIADMDRRGVDRWATIHDLSEISTLLPRLQDH
jgi:phosphoglycolate phosphatase